MKRKILGSSVIAVLAVACLFFISMFGRQYADAKNSQDSFDSLAELVQHELTVHVDSEKELPDSCETAEESLSEAELAQMKNGAVYERNKDFVGWISIDGTSINYPVMQTPNLPNFYLKHAFDKSRSDYGVPYLDENCIPGESCNLIIYGHNMSNGSMFSDLDGYTEKDFFVNHQFIDFCTLSSIGKYQVVAVFRIDADKDTFRYNEYVNMNESEFEAFMNEIRSRQLYDTGVEVSYGDELLTLSTCEYSFDNGRLVIVAKKVT